jgi:cyclopropane-fatty-acyl-phospholipid synthase
MSGTGTLGGGHHGHWRDAGATGIVSRSLSRLFRGYAGSLAVRLWDGTRMAFGTDEPRATVVFRDPRVLSDLVLFRDPVRLADAYFRGRVDVEGDIYEALRIRDHFGGLALSGAERAYLVLAALLLRRAPAPAAGDPAMPRAEHRNTRDSIAFHYDVSNDFYRLWLDEEMVYSCAVYAAADETLEAAQRRKLDLVCTKLRLRPGDRLLDIGCGWGALVIRAAREHGVRAHGITLSRDQYEFARDRIAALGLGGRASVELRDYRDLPGEAVYDKIASVGMFEHVGLANLPRYFSAARRLLKPGGLFLNHGITSREPGWQKSVTTRFINRYVFPDGELDSVANIQGVMERSGFEILHVEALRPHYATTLREWVRRLEANREAAVRVCGERVYRVWRLYMAGCALQFERGDTGVYQILLGKPGGA